MTSLLTCGEDTSKVGAHLMISFTAVHLLKVFIIIIIIFTSDALFLDGVLFSTACT